MKLKAIRETTVAKGVKLSPGTEYEIVKNCRGEWLVSVDGNLHARSNLDAFETPLQRFMSLLKAGAKGVIPPKRPGVSTHLLVTPKYFSIYHHTKGSHWNIFGDHYYYNHDIDTGDYKGGATVSDKDILLKTRLLKTDLVQLIAARG